MRRSKLTVLPDGNLEIVASETVCKALDRALRLHDDGRVTDIVWRLVHHSPFIGEKQGELGFVEFACLSADTLAFLDPRATWAGPPAALKGPAWYWSGEDAWENELAALGRVVFTRTEVED